MGVAYGCYAWWTFPTGGLAFFVCPFRWLTGLRCPLCGLTHSLGALLHGDIGLAFRYHPLGPLLVFCAAALLCFGSHIGHRRHFAAQSRVDG